MPFSANVAAEACPALSQVITPVAGSRWALIRSGLKTDLNPAGGYPPSGTETARTTKMFGPGDGRSDLLAK